MDRGINNPSGRMTKAKTNRLYMDLKEIIRDEALSHLPAKAICRFLAVCKEWKVQMSTPFFIHNQSVSFSSISGFFLQSPGNPPAFISLDRKAYGVPDPELKFLPEPVVLKGSSNGLLCCQGLTGDKPYYVCNPVNQQWKKLPKSTCDHGSDPTIVLLFEPSLLNFVADFKVVCIFASPDIEEAYEFDTYSSLKDSWQVSPEMYFSTKGLEFSRGLGFNGVVYWRMNSDRIVIFDLKKQKVTETYGGRKFFGGDHDIGFSSIGMMNKKPCLSKIYGSSIVMQVLQNKYADKPWVIEREVPLKSADFQYWGDKKRTLLAWDHVVAFQVGGKIYSHDFKTHTTILCGEANLDTQYQTFPYVNSLVSLM